MTKALRIGLHLAPDDPYWVLVREAIYQSAEKCAIHLVSTDAYSGRVLTDQERFARTALPAGFGFRIANRLCFGVGSSPPTFHRALCLEPRRTNDRSLS